MAMDIPNFDNNWLRFKDFITDVADESPKNFQDMIKRVLKRAPDDLVIKTYDLCAGEVKRRMKQRAAAI